jgi:hypothetical protein
MQPYDPSLLDLVKEIPPEECAQLVRAQLRAGRQDTERQLLLALLARATESKNPGEKASMTAFRDAVLAGRKIRWKTFQIESLNGDNDESA